MVFLALAVAEGADALIQRRLPGKGAGLSAAAAGFFVAGAGLVLSTHPTALAPVLARIRDSAESYLPAATLTDPATVQAAGIQAGASLAVTGALFVLAGASLFLAWRRPALRWVVLVLLPLEMAAFALTQSAHFRLAEAVSPQLGDIFARHSGDYRVQNLVEPNNGFLLGAPDIWGNDPGLLKRYAEFVAFTQGEDPNRATQNVDFHSPSPLYALVRLSYIVTATAGGLKTYDVPGALDRVQLVSDYRVQPESATACFSPSVRPEFDPRQTVLLESRSPRSAPRPPSGLERSASSPSSPTNSPSKPISLRSSILLVTDAYSRDWRAHPLAGSSQTQYQVMPADYVLRATPLSAGHHLIQLRLPTFGPLGLEWRFPLSPGALWIALMTLKGEIRR